MKLTARQREALEKAGCGVGYVPRRKQLVLALERRGFVASELNRGGVRQWRLTPAGREALERSE